MRWALIVFFTVLMCFPVTAQEVFEFEGQIIEAEVEDVERTEEGYACRVTELNATYQSGGPAGDTFNIAESGGRATVEVHSVAEEDDISDWLDEYSGWSFSYDEGELSSQPFIN